jgi:NAD(P)-dependent dehydrogenase (short-subunit alcohol dehydrogenase family)
VYDEVRTPAELFDLQGRRAVVTGASSGLGARFARVLAAAGATVVAAARRLDRLEDLAGSTSGIEAFRCDVGDPADRARLAEHVGEGLDILVNNAGISGGLDALEESAADFQQVVDVNLVAAFDLTRAVVARRPAENELAVVNVASILGLVSAAPLAGAGYAASKAGMIGLTRELAGQWGGRGVRVNALAPGWFRSEMTGDLFEDPASARWVQRNTMLRRGGEPGELDSALLFLCSPASAYCTGQVLVVDGGWTAR